MNSDSDSTRTLFLIDGSSCIFRAYFGVSSRLTAPDGTPTNAVFGFKNIIARFIKEFQPGYLVMVFDGKSRTFRHDMYPAYKAHRDKAPDDLVPQFELIHQFVRLMNIPIMVIEGVEADDIIGTLAVRFKNEMPVSIISGDKDLTQLVDDRVKMIDTMKDRVFDTAAVKEKFGVYPDQIVDYLAIVGDASDNIPGAKGIGGKGAAELLNTFGSLEGLEAGKADLKGRRGELLRDAWESVTLSRKLTALNLQVDISQYISAGEGAAPFIRKSPNVPELQKFYEQLGFKADQLLVQRTDEKSSAAGETLPIESGVDRSTYLTITDESALEMFIRAASTAKIACVDLETDGLDRLTANIVGIAAATEGHPAVYIPLRHIDASGQLPADKVLAQFHRLFTEPAMRIVCHNIKFDLGILQRHGLPLPAIADDTMLMAYLIGAEDSSYSLDRLASRLLNHTMIAFDSVTGTGKNRITFDRVALDTATAYAAEDADVTLRLYRILQPKLVSLNLEPIYRTLEIPLAMVLADMEDAGVLLDTAHFARLKERWQAESEDIEQRIYAIAGEVFNVNSPKQLSDILFNKMGIQEHIKKTKTGISTDASVLEKLAPKYEIAAVILQYRTLAKLLNTYIYKLPEDIHPQTGRIHTSFNQTVAATGRLSSNNPNLQNIPIRGEEGKLIRAGFISGPEKIFLSADYSQIELRVLAHLAEDRVLIQTFKEGKDIHTQTAVAILGVEPEEITADDRRLAKAINFGIIYGMGAFRLAMTVGTSQAEAKHFIDTYFDTFSSIRTYIARTVEFAAEHGYVSTLLGRRRVIAGINDRNINTRKGAERVAVNTTIQGTAADIIKKAMLDIAAEFTSAGYRSKMMLQVHDELVFEVVPDELDAVKETVIRLMTGAVAMKVPLDVSCGYGKNWDEAHG